MGSAERSKGARGERELVSLLPGATKVSRSGYTGHDVEWLGYTIEVKRRATGFAFDYKHLQDAQILAKRSDRNDWLITMRLDTLLDIIEDL